MGRYQVSTSQGQQIEVAGGNWLVAVGLGLDALGVVASIDRLACEVLLGGTVIVRDVRAGARFVVQCVPDDDEPLLEIEDPDEDAVLLASAAAEDEEMLLGEEDPDEELEDDPTEDALWGITDISSELMPIDDNEDELRLFRSQPSSRSGEHVQVLTDRSEAVVTLPIEALLEPADRIGSVETRLQALAAQLADSDSSLDAWRLALEGACRLVGAESGAALRREDDGALRFLFAIGPRAHEVLGRRLPPSLGIAGFSTQRRVGLLITEPRRDPRFFSRMDQTTGYTTTSVLAIPVATANEMLGCLEFLNAPKGFQQEQLQWLGALAVSLASRLTAEPG